jgi:16S rRNA (guanine1207-N2)-methyltransferase
MNPALETLLLFLATEETSPACPTLFLGAEPHPDLKSREDLTGWQPSKALADQWGKAGFRSTDDFGDQRWPLVLLLPGKSRDEILAGFSMARDLLAPGGTIVCAMPNTTGASRFEKEFAKAVGSVTSIQKNKCRAFSSAEDGSWNEELFAEWRTLRELRPVGESNYLARAGVFSSDRIDPGSQLLIDHLPVDLKGRAADLGAGWGFLSKEAMQRCRNLTRIDLFENDSRALDCARLNLEGLDREVGFHWHDVTAGLPGKYDIILTNPPFHSGRTTDIELGRTFIRTATASLNHGGKLFLVANRQLPYEEVLDSTGLRWSRLIENQTYKVILAAKG